MPTESPRPGEACARAGSASVGDAHVDHAHLLEELAQVEHELEALAEYRKQLRAKIEGMDVADAG